MLVPFGGTPTWGPWIFWGGGMPPDPPPPSSLRFRPMKLVSSRSEVWLRPWIGGHFCRSRAPQKFYSVSLFFFLIHLVFLSKKIKLPNLKVLMPSFISNSFDNWRNIFSHCKREQTLWWNSPNYSLYVCAISTLVFFMWIFIFISRKTRS